MKALVLTDYKQLEVQQVPTPKPGRGEVLLHIRACGICGSDVHGYDGSTGRRIPPIVMGHEAAGIVESVGEGVTEYKPGDRVTFDSTISCGECFYCRRKQVNLCDAREVIGVSTPAYRRMGAFAEYVVVPERILYRLPESMPFEHAAMIEAVSVGVHAASLTPMEAGSTAVVVGAGMIGLITMQAARLTGAVRVIVADVDDSRLTMATALGADNVFNTRYDDAQAKVRDMTAGHGANVAFECVGITDTVGLAVESVCKGGAVTLVGNISPKIELGLQSVVTRQIRLQGSCASSGEYPECVRLMASGQINVKPLISAIAPIEDGPRWFERLYAREAGLLKVILQP